MRSISCQSRRIHAKFLNIMKLLRFTSFPLTLSHTHSFRRYSVTEINGMSILRIEPVRAGRDDAPYECVAENGVADAVSAEATLSVYESKSH